MSRHSKILAWILRLEYDSIVNVITVYRLATDAALHAQL